MAYPKETMPWLAGTLRGAVSPMLGQWQGLRGGEPTKL